MTVISEQAAASAEVPHEEGTLTRKHEKEGEKKAANR